MSAVAEQMGKKCVINVKIYPQLRHEKQVNDALLLKT